MGSGADTIYFSEEATAHAEEPKELVRVPVKSHTTLYVGLSGHIEKLIDFITKVVG